MSSGEKYTKNSNEDHSYNKEVALEKGEKENNQKPEASHGLTVDHSTSYLETMMHLLKGNVGAGLFAMGDANKNAGIILAPILTITLGLVCVYSQHTLLRLSSQMKTKLALKGYPDFAETVKLCFEHGPPKLRSWAELMKIIVNIFLCVTQLGFCCIYFVFISSNLKHVLNYYEIVLSTHTIMAIILIPIMLPSLITNLKYLVYCSTFANICIVTGIAMTVYFASQNLPAISDRHYVASLEQIPLYFGTAIFAFEGISLVLPLQNSMTKPKSFIKPFGVLNIGMTIVTILLVSVGFLGYLKYGDNVEGSLTLNLPQENFFAQSVTVIISIGVLLGYALQFFVAIQIMWKPIQHKFNINRHPQLCQIVFRVIMVLVTFGIAETVPKLSLFISLNGALCSTALALVFPPVIELVSKWEPSKGPGALVLIRNIVILIFALLGFLTGTYFILNVSILSALIAKTQISLALIKWSCNLPVTPYFFKTKC